MFAKFLEKHFGTYKSLRQVQQLWINMNINSNNERKYDSDLII